MHKIKFKKAANKDKTFTTRFLYVIDIRFQEFLHLCKLTKNREDIDNRILNMINLIQGVRLGSFAMDLPPNTKSIDYEKVVNQKEEGEYKDDGKRHITNDSQHPELKMKEDEMWKRDIVGKHAKLTPC